MPAERPAGSGGSEAPAMVEQLDTAVITPAMLEEEEQLEAAGLERERKMLEKARMSWDRESTEIRYRRLQHLLEKSNIYSKFLLTKMEQQQLETVMKI
ncbi:HELLS isoform 12 [Pan troglodytes]|uniref:Helicase, lymphoid specific n=7 Tax=Hominoidea TaxID=314295 RepID=Q76H82_HUMAN|nr:helicase, lymphoid specific [Homo sapiens]KAI4076888.1 helicase, lymphoid specific [Homo sapiens]PNI82257.1 HELLS isoform 12 [Pan troglodytes]PNJ89512.1 HELLS isoform 4 [Pongo abelii]BAD10844.1 lymphoid specific helicase variant1 [Homo sapiens]